MAILATVLFRNLDYETSLAFVILIVCQGIMILASVHELVQTSQLDEPRIQHLYDEMEQKRGQFESQLTSKTTDRQVTDSQRNLI